MATSSTSEPDDTGTLPSVSVIGLGEMGSALAGAFLAGGCTATVWNRSPEKADALVARGAQASETVEAAVAASEVVVVNVKGNDVAGKLLASAGEVLSGSVVVNLTDGTSRQAGEVAQLVADRGGEYLHGQIMTIAPGIGHPDAVVFYGGSEAVFARYRSTLAVLSGHQTYVGPDPGASSLYGMAVHATMWGTLNGYLQAAALLRSEGLPAKQFLEQAKASLSSIMAFLEPVSDEIDRGEHAVPFGALKHHLPSIDDLVEESQARGVDDGLPRLTRSLVAKAIADGHENDSYSRLIDYFG